MQLTKDEGELLNLIIQKRIRFYCDIRDKFTAEERKARDKVNTAFNEFTEELQPEQVKILEEYEDMIVDGLAKEVELAYRGGVKDGIRLKAFLQKVGK